jgi:hypothetical protein
MCLQKTGKHGLHVCLAHVYGGSPAKSHPNPYTLHKSNAALSQPHACARACASCQDIALAQPPATRPSTALAHTVSELQNVAPGLRAVPGPQSLAWHWSTCLQQLWQFCVPGVHSWPRCFATHSFNFDHLCLRGDSSTQGCGHSFSARPPACYHRVPIGRRTTRRWWGSGPG